MSNTIGIMFGFLGGTIVGGDKGYKAFPNPCKEKIYNRLSDAKWFLALRWCDNMTTPAAILTNIGEFSFYNEIVQDIGEESFIPRKYRQDIFARSLLLESNQTAIYSLKSPDRAIEIQAVEIDPRYGKVALVKELQDEGVRSSK